MTHNLQLRHQVIKAIRRYLEDGGFIEVETPILTAPPRRRTGLPRTQPRQSREWFALPQSPQLFKQLLMVSGFDRYLKSPCFRDEDLRADRQPEFTQLDMEMSFMSQAEILHLNEDLVCHVLKIKNWNAPFRVSPTLRRSVTAAINLTPALAWNRQRLRSSQRLWFQSLF